MITIFNAPLQSAEPLSTGQPGTPSRGEDVEVEFAALLDDTPEQSDQVVSDDGDRDPPLTMQTKEATEAERVIENALDGIEPRSDDLSLEATVASSKPVIEGQAHGDDTDVNPDQGAGGEGGEWPPAIMGNAASRLSQAEPVATVFPTAGSNQDLGEDSSVQDEPLIDAEGENSSEGRREAGGSDKEAGAKALLPRAEAEKAPAQRDASAVTTAQPAPRQEVINGASERAVGHQAAKAAEGKSGAAEVSETVILQAAGGKPSSAAPMSDAQVQARAAEQNFMDMVDRLNTPQAKAPEQIHKAPRPLPEFKSPLTASVAGQIQSHDVQDGKVTIRLRPHGMGIIEVEIARQLNGTSNVTLRVQNPLVLEALRAEAGAVSEIWADQGGVDLEMFNHKDGQNSQSEAAKKSSVTAEVTDEPETEEATHNALSGIII